VLHDNGGEIVSAIVPAICDRSGPLFCAGTRSHHSDHWRCDRNVANPSTPNGRRVMCCWSTGSTQIFGIVVLSRASRVRRAAWSHKPRHAVDHLAAVCLSKPSTYVRAISSFLVSSRLSDTGTCNSQRQLDLMLPFISASSGTPRLRVCHGWLSLCVSSWNLWGTNEYPQARVACWHSRHVMRRWSRSRFV